VLLVDLALLLDLHGDALPLGPIVITALVIGYGWWFRQQAIRQRRPPVIRAA